MNKDIQDSVDFLTREIIVEYTKERFLAEEEFEELKSKTYAVLVSMAREGKIKIEQKENFLNFQIPLQS